MIMGIDRLAQRLMSAGARVNAALSAELLAVAEEASNTARDFAPEGTPPRDEPRLKDSFSAGVSGLTAFARVRNPHAAYVEFGTGRRGAGAGAGGSYDADWPGMSAQPYMQPAARLAAVDFAKRMDEAAVRAI